MPGETGIRPEAEKEEECLICSFAMKDRRYFTVFPCSCNGLTVCAMCALRMRYFVKEANCPFCKEPWKKILFTKNANEKKFEKIDWNAKYYDPSIKVYFDNTDDYLLFKHLRSYHCVICSKNGSDFHCESMIELAEHLKSVHQKYFCEICAGSEKIFPYEFALYSKSELVEHKEKGFYKSRNRTKMDPHPHCKFCNEYFFDSDEFYLHLERKHFSCTFCRSKGLHVYEANILDLREHFRRKHFLCEASECMGQKMAVFNTARELREHSHNFHGNSNRNGKGKNSYITEFTKRRNATRENFTSHSNSSITFPELPKSTIYTGIPSRNSRLNFSQNGVSFNSKIQNIPLPPLPISSNNSPMQCLNNSKNFSNSHTARKNKKKKNSRLDKLILTPSTPKAKFKPYKYEEVPLKLAQLYKQLKAIDPAKFDSFKTIYTDFLSSKSSPQKFAAKFLRLYGENSHSKKTLQELSKMVSDHEKALRLYNCASKTDKELRSRL